MTALILAEESGVLFDLGIRVQVLVAQALIFLVTFFILRKILFARVLDHMVAREAEAGRVEEKIRADRAEAERLSREYEAHLARIDKEAWERLQGVLKEAIEARGKITAEAQARAAQETKTALAAIARDRDAALDGLRKEIPALSRQVVERVIGLPLEPDALQASSKGGAR